MKKILALVLTVVLLAAATVSAFAVDSPTAQGPALAATADNVADCFIIPWADRDQLADAKVQAFTAAKACLKDSIPEGFLCRIFAYFDIEGDFDDCNIAMVMNGADAIEPDDSIHAVFTMDTKTNGASEVVILQYVNGEWAEKGASIDGDVVIAEALVDAPMAVFMK